jgi:hypothetical protein
MAEQKWQLHRQAAAAFLVALPLPSLLCRHGMVEWRDGGMAEWRSGKMAEWRNGGWRNSGTAEWRKGYIPNLPDIFTVNTDDDNDDNNNDDDDDTF